MDTNERLRQRALRLIKEGVSQKILAGRMGMKTPTFSKWLNRKGGINPVSVVAMDGLATYERDLAAVLREDPTLRSAGAGFSDEWDGKAERRSGEDRRVAGE